MSDSPRWHLDGLPGTTGIVEVMLYDDHVAAVAAARQDGYNAAWSLSAAEIERQVREEEQVAQALARAELYSMEEMDDRCTQAADDAFAEGLRMARDAVKTECLSHHGYTPGQTCPYCTDGLAAIDALEKP